MPPGSAMLFPTIIRTFITNHESISVRVIGKAASVLEFNDLNAAKGKMHRRYSGASQLQGITLELHSYSMYLHFGFKRRY